MSEKITAKEAINELQEYRNLLMESPSDSVIDTGCVMAKAMELFLRMDKANEVDKRTEPALHKHIVSVSVCTKCGCNKMTGDGSKSWCLNEDCDFVEAD